MQLGLKEIFYALLVIILIVSFFYKYIMFEDQNGPKINDSECCSGSYN